MRALEFALSTVMIYVVTLSFASWVATTIGNRIVELFAQILEVMP